MKFLILLAFGFFLYLSLRIIWNVQVKKEEIPEGTGWAVIAVWMATVVLGIFAAWLIW